MFENLSSGQGQAPVTGANATPAPATNLNPTPAPAQAPTPPVQPVDMYAGVDQGLGSPIMPSSSPAAPGMPQISQIEDSGNNKKYFIIGLLVLLIAAIIGGGVFAYQKFTAPAAITEPAPQPVEPKVVTTPVVTPTTPTTTATSTFETATTSPLATETATSSLATTTEPSATSSIVATATDMTKDTDADGLTDYEEFNFYHSNPDLADTDGDGFKDGDEVRKGYNPLGAGKLIDSKITQTATTSVK